MENASSESGYCFHISFWLNLVTLLVFCEGGVAPVINVLPALLTTLKIKCSFYFLYTKCVIYFVLLVIQMKHNVWYNIAKSYDTFFLVIIFIFSYLFAEKNYYQIYVSKLLVYFPKKKIILYYLFRYMMCVDFYKNVWIFYQCCPYL